MFLPRLSGKAMLQASFHWPPLIPLRLDLIFIILFVFLGLVLAILAFMIGKYDQCALS